jgi:DNA-binding MarR family transcriptional regulator
VCYRFLVNDGMLLEQQVCFALHAASRAATAVYRPLLGELGITYPQYLVLLALWERDGRGVGDLCEQLFLDTGTVSPLLKRLQALGLVERTRLAGDERRVEIRLTVAGRALRVAAGELPRRLFEAAGSTPQELAGLRETLVQLTNLLHEYTQRKDLQ